MRTPEERAERRAAREAARLLAGTTRHLTLPVPPDDALALVKEAVEQRSPMMRLQRCTEDTATVSVMGGLIGTWGVSGNIGAATGLLGGGNGVKLSWAPRGDGTEYTAHAPSVGAMMIMRSEIQSIFRALNDAWFARERWQARKQT